MAGVARPSARPAIETCTVALGAIAQLAHAEAQILAVEVVRHGVIPARLVRKGGMAGEASDAAGAAGKRLLVAGHALGVVVVPVMKDRAVEVCRRLDVPAGLVDLCTWRAWCREIPVQLPAPCNSQTKEDDNNGKPCKPH